MVLTTYNFPGWVNHLENISMRGGMGSKFSEKERKRKSQFLLNLENWDKALMAYEDQIIGRRQLSIAEMEKHKGEIF